ncbi:hypothetical protein BOSEA31B_12426 [Hyphomicrobiales bacterium]|nr:hypothetical protein BOSEA31B_12426 [Hyphomicrobiales bacterium]CAH1698206.1 hypothetical protein BOSEA1005_11252 [Hyphomicrobiales bacterium]CAI0347849.1 hypothetical protein BO1005MUT1_90210 [Hyphomicrobiales bacterium]
MEVRPLFRPIGRDASGLVEALLADAEGAALELAERYPARIALEIELRAIDGIAAAMLRTCCRFGLVELPVGPQVDQDRPVLGLPPADGGLFEKAGAIDPIELDLERADRTAAGREAGSELAESLKNLTEWHGSSPCCGDG